MTARPTLRVMALHALAYCERLFYLEEVEEIRVADAAVWAGRRLHQELDEAGEVVELTLESERLGIRGRMDAIRRRDGSLYPVEHKRGRAMRGKTAEATAWPSDVLQAAAYALLLEEHSGRTVPEARVRYHADAVTVRVAITEDLRRAVGESVERGRLLARAPDRPPVTPDERKCVRCSLAPVCLPEEVRLAAAHERGDDFTPIRLFPPDEERRSLHVVTQGARVGRSGDSFVVSDRDGEGARVGAREVSDIVIHGHAQITTQALRRCVDDDIPVHFVTTTGGYVGTFAAPGIAVQRRIRQYRALTDECASFELARRIVCAKVENQVRFVLRGSRKAEPLRQAVEASLRLMRAALRGIARAVSREELMGHEGIAARAYFAALSILVHPDAGELMRPEGRSRRPPADRFNALLSFAYGLLYRDVTSAILRVGLEPAFGVLHQPRSAAAPLVLDIMELFRVPVADIAVLAAVNRRTFDPEADFSVAGRQVWLSDTGRRKAIEVHERRKHEESKHPAIGYTLSYARMMEFEVRLFEKAWSGEPDLFARFRMR